VAQDRQRSRRRRSRQSGSGATPVPEPTEHAFPDVEEARLAEEGPVDDAALDTEPSALDQVSAPPRAPIERERDHRVGGNRVFGFLGHVVDELRRVQWPDRRQVGQSTLVVLLFVIIAGSYLGLLDAIWQPLIKAIL
jgi:preprotein translocase SecE subunit